MIYFVWTDPCPIYAGRGGTESYTIGHARELKSRGIDVKILTMGHGELDGRQFYPDVQFETIASINELSSLDGTILFINIPHIVPTKRKAYVLYHFPPLEEHGTRDHFIKATAGKTVMVNGKFLRGLCADFLKMNEKDIHIVYPFADPAFAAVERPPRKYADKTRVLFAGRLHPEKGIYTLMEAVHHDILKEGYEFSATRAGNETGPGQLIETLLQAHPRVRVVDSRKTPAGVARLLAQYDVLAMPSNHQYWHEGFGMLSVEAQHAGCRVVASNDGGLPETDCGSLILVEPGNSMALARGIQAAAKAGPVSNAARNRTHRHFTRKESVDALINIFENY